MGIVTITSETTKNPITHIGFCAGVCQDADVSDDKKNYERGLQCIKNNHGRAMEYANVEMIFENFSARVIRQWYTHIGGAPSRMQESTRYVDCGNFNYVVPPTIYNNAEACRIYMDTMKSIQDGYNILENLGIPKEDAAMVLPLGMTTKIIDKRNARSLMDMSRQRMCGRAYLEFRLLFEQVCIALSKYSEEWETLIDMCYYPKCEEYGYCTEPKSCGRMPKRT